MRLFLLLGIWVCGISGLCNLVSGNPIPGLFLIGAGICLNKAEILFYYKPTENAQ